MWSIPTAGRKITVNLLLIIRTVIRLCGESRQRQNDRAALVQAAADATHLARLNDMDTWKKNLVRGPARIHYLSGETIY